MVSGGVASRWERLRRHLIAAMLERDDVCLNRFWDSLLVCFLIQAVGWVLEAGSDDQTLFYGFA